MDELAVRKSRVDMVKGDGKRAYLPHPIYQMTLFNATRTRSEGEYRKEGLVVVTENNFGDNITIWTPKTLFTTPDMGVFLGVVACAQRAGIHKMVGPSGPDSFALFSEFPISVLYDITGINSQGKGWYQLRSSLEALGSVRIRIEYHRDSENLKKHDWARGYVFDYFWRMTIVERKGRKGSLVKLYPSPVLIPRDFYLWADAELCNKLKKDTAKGIFWQLICREHLCGTVEEWRKWLGAGEEWEAKKWKSARLMPALEELADYGYLVKENGDEITVGRPGSDRKRVRKSKHRRS